MGQAKPFEFGKEGRDIIADLINGVLKKLQRFGICATWKVPRFDGDLDLQQYGRCKLAIVLQIQNLSRSVPEIRYYPGNPGACCTEYMDCPCDGHGIDRHGGGGSKNVEELTCMPQSDAKCMEIAERYLGRGMNCRHWSAARQLD